MDILRGVRLTLKTQFKVISWQAKTKMRCQHQYTRRFIAHVKHAYFCFTEIYFRREHFAAVCLQ